MASDEASGDLDETLAFVATLTSDARATISPDELATERAFVEGRHDEPVALAAPRDLPRVRVGPSPGEGADLELLGPIAQGGMGRIEAAVQRAFPREVAIKRVRPDRRCASALDALLREASITGRLDHPNIVPAHLLAQTDDDDPVLVMKRIEGVSFAALIHDPEHPAWAGHAEDPLGRHLEILAQVCNALELAHRRGVVHRDLKPDNVMVGELGEVYVLDWGIAVELDRPRSRSLAGTPAYMAPEMLAGAAKVTPATDVYLLGAMLHEILTGEPPHRGATLIAVVMAAVESEPFDYGEDVPAELARICHRAMAKDPADRYPSALALREALLDHLRHRGSMDLVREGEAKLRALRGGVEAAATETRRADVRRLAAEADFAFRQALRTWPGNEAARARRQECGELMIDFELAARNAPGAAALLQDLSTPRPELAARVEALEAELAEEARAKEALERFGRERDFAVSAPVRIRLLMAVHGSLLVPTLALIALDVELSTGMLAGAILLGSALYGGLAWARRDSLFATEANRRLQLSLAAWLATGLVLAVTAWVTGAPVDPTLAAILVLSAFAAVQIAIWTEPSTWVYPVVWLPVGLLQWLWPGHGFHVIAIISVASLAAAVVRMRIRRRPPDQSLGTARE